MTLSISIAQVHLVRPVLHSHLRRTRLFLSVILQQDVWGRNL